MEIHVIKADWADHLDTLRAIRETVFIDEQNVPKEIEWDGEDANSTHFLAINELGQYVGCARLLPSGQIGRMAVLKDHRGYGIGAKLLHAAVEEGKAQKFDRLFLHAQQYAEVFYRKGGFLPYGEPFQEANIEHIAMEMKLPLPFEPSQHAVIPEPQVRPQAVRPALLQAEPQATSFEGYVECSEALLSIIKNARRRLLIFSPFLDHELFDKGEIVSSLSELARSAARVEIQILIFDSKPLVDRSHQIVELARRLDEKIKIRVLSDRPNNQSSSFVCADLDAYWLLPSYDKHDGIADMANPVTCKRLTEVFNAAWAKSREDQELRTLRL